jgi:hypothetical protein
MASFSITSIASERFRNKPMTKRNRIEERIAKKEMEIQELEMKLREAKAYIQALQDVMKMMPREESDSTHSRESTDSTMRDGSYVSDAREAIRKAGNPLHVVDILKASGRPTDRKSRLGMGGSLAAYVRRGEVFTRPKPNTFGLIELETAKPSHQVPTSRSAAPPDDFGIDHTEDETTH